MNYHIFRALLLIVASLACLAGLGFGAATAQPDPANATNVSVGLPGGGEEPETVQIDPATTLVSSEFDSESGTARVTLKSEVPQLVTVWDVNGFADDNRIKPRTVRLDPGEETSVEIPVIEGNDGQVGVGIGTDNVWYRERLRAPSESALDAPATAFDVLLAGLLSSTAMGGVVLRQARRKAQESEPVSEQIL